MRYFMLISKQLKKLQKSFHKKTAARLLPEDEPGAMAKTTAQLLQYLDKCLWLRRLRV
jgi:hypothetical protein